MPVRLPPLAGHVPDADLLARFARDRDEAAFELLVWRYRKLVMGVCRRTVGDHHAAEDAAQAAFLVLARKAGGVRGNLAGWLARVAYRCAAKVRRSFGARSVSEGLDSRPSLTLRAPKDPDLTAILDAELDRLSDKYRVPVVLCYLDGKTYEAAAAQLGLPVGTLSGRLTKAKALLRDRLTRRGVALGVVLSQLAADAAEPGRFITSVTQAATAFAAGQPTPAGPAAVAAGVLRTMSLHKLIAATAAGFIAVAVSAGVVAEAAAGRPAGLNPAARQKPPTDRDLLHGEWLFDAATDEKGNNNLNNMYGRARLTFDKDQVAITQSPVSAATIGTTFAIDTTASPKRMDWEVPEFYRTLLRVPAGTARGIYKFEDADTLTVCMGNSPLVDRPKEFKAGGGHFLFTVKRWKGPPGAKFTEATVRVLDPDGKPTDGAEMLINEIRQPDREPSVTRWVISRTAKGVATFDPEKVSTILVAHDPARNLIGVAKSSPAALHYGLTIRLQPAVKITGKLASPELVRAGTDIGWTNVYLQSGPNSWSSYAATDGTFEFVAPPGEYTLNAYGERVGKKLVPLSVSADKPEVDTGTIELKANDWGLLIGKPAPELADVAGWKGTPVKLADLKGQVVILWFWMYHDNPLRELVTLHDAVAMHAGRGERVVLVHNDWPGGIDTAAKLDEKLAKEWARIAGGKLTMIPDLQFEKAAKKWADDWGGKGLPFPIALTVGDKKYDIPSLVTTRRSRAAADYGVEYWPFGVLIDRKGIVRGAFAPNVARDVKLLEQLLAEK